MKQSKPLWIMFTADGFYPIEPSAKCKPEDHGRLNPHVARHRGYGWHNTLAARPHQRRGRVMVSGSEVMRAAELAMGSSARVMEDYSFQRRHGWDVYWTPEAAIRLASRARFVERLIWC